MTSRRDRDVNLTPRRVNPHRDVAERCNFDVATWELHVATWQRGSPKKFLTHYSAHFFENSPRVNFILDIEHSARPAPTLLGPEIKLASRNNEHGNS